MVFIECIPLGLSKVPHELVAFSCRGGTWTWEVWFPAVCDERIVWSMLLKLADYYLATPRDCCGWGCL